MQTGKRYYVLAIQRPYGNDAFIFGSPWPPEADWDNGERLFGPYSTYEEAKSVVNEIEVGNKCLQASCGKTDGRGHETMKPVYMVATWKEYPFENLLDIRFARDEEGIKTIISDEYNELYSKEVYNFRFDWQEMEVTFSAKAPWDDEADQGRVYLVPIYEVKGGKIE